MKEELEKNNTVLSLIVAMGEKRAIGKDGNLLWRLNNDMRYFKNTTWSFPVIMGRKTFETLPKALEGRTNIVLSRNTRELPGAITVNSLDVAVSEACKLKTSEIFVIGGGEIYRSTLPVAERLYLTRVHHVFQNADTFFPEVDFNNWKRLSCNRFEADDKNEYAHSIEIWERVNPAD